MYSIYADDTLIYNPSVTQLCLYDIVLNLEDNSAGTMSFSMTSDHLAFWTLKKLATLITVKNDGAVLWKGRIISDDVDINNVKKIQCEGKLAFLNDSIFPAFNFSGSPEQLFRDMIENHNSLVSARQRFLVGNVTVKDNNNYIVRSSIYDTRTWAALKEKCFQSTLGGHLQVRYEADGDYIDWLEDYTEVSSQSITFGKNIIDLLVNSSATETFTAIRPQGAADENSTERIDITSVNDGKDYIVDEEKAAEYGIIFADPENSIWEDVTLPQNLLAKARERLKSGITLKKTIDVRAVDLNLTDAEIEALKVCTYVQVVSPIHGIAEYYLLSKAEIHMDAPEHTQYTLGAVKATFTDASKLQITSVAQSVGAAIPSAVSQLKNDEKFVTEDKVVEVIKETAVSPIVEVAEESEGVYKIRITSASGKIESPNLVGPPGDPGAPGEAGTPGENGKSPYEIAVQNGFSGSEEEWLKTLQGKTPVIGENGNWFIDGEDTGLLSRGEPGKQGDPGKPGAPGENGKSTYEIAVQNGFLGSEAEWLKTLQGEAPVIGENGNWFIGGEDTGLPSRGEPGNPGVPGEAGAPGENGKSPYEIAVQNGFSGSEAEWLAALQGKTPVIGENGNWFIDGKDTGLPSRGEPGEKGDPGAGGSYEILGTSEEVKKNTTAGLLVDALVIKEVFQSVSDGKRVIALAITDKGISTSATDSFADMAANIGLIQGGGSGQGTVVRQLINFSMPAPEGKPQIDVYGKLDAQASPTVKSCIKANITVREG